MSIAIDLRAVHHYGNVDLVHDTTVCLENVWARGSDEKRGQFQAQMKVIWHRVSRVEAPESVRVSWRRAAVVAQATEQEKDVVYCSLSGCSHTAKSLLACGCGAGYCDTVCQRR